MKKNMKKVVDKLNSDVTDLDAFVEGSVVISLDLDKDALEGIDARMATGLYLSKGEVVRDILRHEMEAEGWPKAKKSNKKK